jgi:hypothetical protein
VSRRGETRGRPPLADSVVKVLLTMPQKLRDDIAALAEAEGRTAAEVWRAAGQAWVARYRKGDR